MVFQQPQKLGLTSATCLVIANMIGAGVFTTSGFALHDLGAPKQVLVAWIIGGLIAMCGAIGYGMLATQIRESGGEYVFLARVIHPLAGFLAGWVSLLAGFTGAIAFAAATLEAYALPNSHGLVAISAICLCGLFHVMGLRVGAIGQNLIVALKLLLILGFLGLAAIKLPTLPVQLDLEPRPFLISTFAMTLVWISLSYSGFNAAVYVAEEVHDSSRIVPRALWLGTALVGVMYLALNAAFVFTSPTSAIAGREDVAAASAEILGGASLAAAMRVLIGLALLSSISAMVMAGPRVYAQMAKDGLFPRLFASGEQVPTAAIGLQVALACGLVLMTKLQTLLSYLGFTLSLSAAATVASLFVLRAREGGRRDPWMIAPAAYVAATFVLATLAANQRPWELLGTLVTVVSGLAAYALFHRKK